MAGICFNRMIVNRFGMSVHDELTGDQQRELLHGYYAAVSFIDSLIAELLSELEATGKADNTIVVVWGDHGFHLGDHGLWGKHTTMEQANRVPIWASQGRPLVPSWPRPASRPVPGLTFSRRRPGPPNVLRYLN